MDETYRGDAKTDISRVNADSPPLLNNVRTNSNKFEQIRDNADQFGKFWAGVHSAGSAIWPHCNSQRQGASVPRESGWSPSCGGYFAPTS